MKKLANGRCAYFGCAAEFAIGHSHCRKHLARISKERKKDVQARKRHGPCVDCGERPQFWSLHCIICRQRHVKNPEALPLGVTRALRLYYQAEHQLIIEQSRAKTRFEVRKLLAKGDTNRNQAKALRLYAGIDDGRWRNHAEVGRLMQISRERVRQLLGPYKAILSETAVQTSADNDHNQPKASPVSFGAVATLDV
jgi:hypothetical protein